MNAMNRRSFLTAALSAAALYVTSRLPWSPHGAVFRVVRVDPDGSGMEYSGHLGRVVYNAERCCKNCQVIFAAWRPGGDVANGPSFVDSELQAVSPAARRMLEEIEAVKRLRGEAFFYQAV
jgi:hypothetical protein